MSKYALITSCTTCPYGDLNRDGEYVCSYYEDNKRTFSKRERRFAQFQPDWCPLPTAWDILKAHLR